MGPGVRRDDAELDASPMSLALPAPRARSRLSATPGQIALALGIAAFLALFLVWPSATVIYVAFTEKGGGAFTLVNFVDFFRTDLFLRSFWNSFYVSAMAVAGASILALPLAYITSRFAFRGTVLNGTPQIQDRWKRGVGLVTGMIPDDVSRVYVQRYFPPETKRAADALVRNIIAAMDRRLQTLSWMAPATRERARAKLRAFTPKIGYPDFWHDYSSIQISRTNLVQNVMNALEWDYQFDLHRLGRPVDRREWGMTPMTINAYANPVWNEIVFPAAILQPPFFDPHADMAVNYGGIGAVIGHELSHHFDDQGSQYDEHGALAEWWTPQDRERFNALTAQLVAEYDAYEPLPGHHVQGRLTLGENIADLAGLTVSYDAYHHALGNRRAKAVMDYLTSLGIAADRVSTVSKGEEQPVCTEHNEGCWSKNRRGHMIATAK